MGVVIQMRRGLSAAHTSYTGAAGEITVTTDDGRAHVHDGETAGGRALALLADVQALAARVAELEAMISTGVLMLPTVTGDVTIPDGYTGVIAGEPSDTATVTGAGDATLTGV